MNLDVSPPAQTSSVISFSIHETTIKGLVGCYFLEEIFEPDYMVFSSQSRASSPQLHMPSPTMPGTTKWSTSPCTWQMKASHVSPWQKFYWCLKDSPKLQISLTGNLWVSYWMFLTHLVTQLLWMVAHQPPMKCPCYYPVYVREWQILRRHFYLVVILLVFPPIFLSQSNRNLHYYCPIQNLVLTSFTLWLGAQILQPPLPSVSTKERHKNIQSDIKYTKS